MTLASLFRLFAFALLVAAMGCDTSDGPSLFDPDRPVGADPVVSSISPTGVVLAGIDEITISGSNFSETPGDNVVFFGDVIAEVLSASSTELRVKAPNTPAEDIAIRVSVRGAAQFSPAVLFTLTPAVVPFGGIDPTTVPFGIATDAAGNLYLAQNKDNTRQIVRIAPDGTQSLFTSPDFDYVDLEVGGDGAVYAVRNVFAAFRLPEGAARENYAIFSEGRPSLSTIAGDGASTFYVGGNNGVTPSTPSATQSIYRIAPDRSITAYELDGNVRALAVFDGGVYAAVTQTGTSRIFRFPADAAGDLGVPLLYADVTAASGAEATSLAFAASGDLYVGTTARQDPLYVVAPDGSAEVVYPGVLTGPAASLAYGPDSKLYMRTAEVRNASEEIIQARQLVRVETRQEGAR